MLVFNTYGAEVVSDGFPQIVYRQTFNFLFYFLEFSDTEKYHLVDPKVKPRSV